MDRTSLSVLRHGPEPQMTVNTLGTTAIDDTGTSRRSQIWHPSSWGQTA